MIHSNRNNYDLSFRHVRTNLPDNPDTYLPPGAIPFLIKENGNIGIGATIEPTEKLQIQDGNLRFHMMNGAGGKSQKIEWYENASGNDNVQLSYFGQNLNGGGRGQDRLIFSNGDWLSSEINDASNSNQEHTNIMMTMRLGNKAVGIGTLNPRWRLDVVGPVNATEYRINGNLVNFSGGTNPWTLSGANINYPSGNVGIGKPTPVYPLDVAGSVNATEYRLNGNVINLGGGNNPWTLSGTNVNYSGGNVGIGTTTPSSLLTLHRQFTTKPGNDLRGPSMKIQTTNGSTSWDLGSVEGVVGNPGDINGYPGGLAFFTKPNGTHNVEMIERMRIDYDGRFAMGTSKIIPGTRLHVDGRVYISGNGGTEKGFVSQTSDNYKDYLLWVEEGIVSKDFAIATTTEWPDYVFAKDYKLPSLNTIEQSIKENGHLPTMPSAKDIEENGFTVNDMTKRMVKTIEELTLHTIDQKKQIDGQNKLVAELLQRLEKLEKHIN